MTRFALKRNTLINANPPTYEAFQYLEQASLFFGVNYPKSQELTYKAIAADSTYTWAFLQLGWGFANQGHYGKMDSIVKLIDRRFSNLSFYEKTYLESMREDVRGNLAGYLRHMETAFKKDPKHLSNAYMAGLGARELDQPSKAVNYFGSVDPGSYKIEKQTDTWWYYEFARSLVRTGRLDEALSILNHVPDEMATNSIYTTRAYIYILKNQQDSLYSLTSKLKTHSPTSNSYSIVCNGIAQKYALINDGQNQMKWAMMSLDYLKSMPKADKDETWAMAYVLAGQLKESLKVYEELLKKSVDWSTLSRIGCLQAKLGNTKMALATAAELERMDLPFPRGRIKYGLARIYAACGEKERSVDLLKQAFNEGFGFGFNDYDYDFEFLPLFDYPPFQEFVKPKG